DAEAGKLLEQEAQALGVVVLEGVATGPGPAPRIVVSDDETLRRLGAVLESRGERALGTALRSSLTSYHRTGVFIPFADGERMDLGSRTRVVGILNVTPDSFADGGDMPGPEAAIE